MPWIATALRYLPTAANACKLFSGSPRAEKAQPEKNDAEVIRTLIRNTLQRELENPQSIYQKKVQRLIAKSPEKSLFSLVRQFQIINQTQADSHPVTITRPKHYCVQVDPLLPKTQLPFLLKRQLAYLLHRDFFYRGILNVGCSLATSGGAHYLDLSLIPSLGLTIAASSAVHVVYSRMMENRADDFAKRRSQRRDLQQGVAFLHRQKAKLRKKFQLASMCPHLASCTENPGRSSPTARIRSVFFNRPSNKDA